MKNNLIQFKFDEEKIFLLIFNQIEYLKLKIIKIYNIPYFYNTFKKTATL